MKFAINTRVMNLVLLETVIPNLVVELAYASPANFVGRAVYPPTARAYLLEGTALRLLAASQALERHQLRLKVLDAYRPRPVQEIFWALMPDPRYVANPLDGSRHSRGASVDVTLIDHLGRELPMPSQFDDFSERAHRNYTACAGECLENRRLLQEAMAQAGFLPLETEWWHFDDPEWNQHPLLDITFEALA